MRHNCRMNEGHPVILKAAASRFACPLEIKQTFSKAERPGRDVRPGRFKLRTRGDARYLTIAR